MHRCLRGDGDTSGIGIDNELDDINESVQHLGHDDKTHMEVINEEMNKDQPSISNQQEMISNSMPPKELRDVSSHPLKLIICNPCCSVHRLEWWVCLLELKGFGLNNNIMIWESHHLVSWSLGNLLFVRVWAGGLVMQGEDTSPSVHPTYGKLHYWLIVIISRVSICWSHFRFKTYLPSWESLYIIGLNPNCSRV